MQISKVTNVSNSGPMSPIRLRVCDTKILGEVLSAVISFFVARNMVRSTLCLCLDVPGAQSYESQPFKKCGGVKVVFSRLLRIQEVPSKSERQGCRSILDLSPDQVSAQLDFTRPGPSQFTVRVCVMMAEKMSKF